MLNRLLKRELPLLIESLVELMDEFPEWRIVLDGFLENDRSRSEHHTKKRNWKKKFS